MDTISVVALGGGGCITEVVKCQYELTQLESGAAVYAFMGFPKHYVCPYCFEQTLLQVLQYRCVGVGYFECPGCKVSFPVKPSPGLVARV
jgi:hypothetical protein